MTKNSPPLAKEVTFRTALSNFATGVTIVTATDDHGQMVGVTANSFNSVSIDPPLILWSLAKKSSSCTVFENSSHFIVHVLAQSQLELAKHFARSSDKKFDHVEHSLTSNGIPTFANCCSRFHCQQIARHAGGDHWVFIAEVIEFDTNDTNPLLFYRGKYDKLNFETIT